MKPARRITDSDLRAIIRDEIGRMIEDDTLGAAVRLVVTAVLVDAGIEEVFVARRDRTKAN